MASPVDDTYTAASGATVYGGRSVPLPVWLYGTPLNVWVPIANTAGAGGSAVHAYSGMALKSSTSEIIIAAAGGHLDSSDNRVVSLDLSADAPSWTTRKAASAAGDVVSDSSYYADGTPSSRHTYWSTHYVAPRSRVMLFGAYAPYGSGVTTPETVDGFDLARNAWDAAGTWGDIISSASTPQCLDPDGNMWAAVNTSVYKWNEATQTQSLLHDFGSGDFARVSCWDSTRSELISIGFGNGRDPDDTKTLNAYAIAGDGLTRTALTLNASAAATQFLSEAPYGHALVYDAWNDRCLIYAGGLGYGGQVGDPADIYCFARNGDTLDVSILSLGAGSVAPAFGHSNNAGVFNRFAIVPNLKGAVYVNSAAAAPISFIPLAA